MWEGCAGGRMTPRAARPFLSITTEKVYRMYSLYRLYIDVQILRAIPAPR
jgi:hypothetical protein